MQKIIVMLIVLATVTGIVSANAWISPVGDPNNFWNEGKNWSENRVPGDTEKTTFTNLSAECILNTVAVCGQLVVGDNGGNDFVRELTITAGGSLTCGGSAWAASGYNRSAIVTVEEGGSLESVTRFGIGLINSKIVGTTQASFLNINGGDMTVNGNLQIGSVADAEGDIHKGTVNVYLGTLDVSGNLDYRAAGDPDVGLIDVSYGTLTVSGDRVADLDDRVASGTLVGFGGAGTLNYDYDVTTPGKTTITATHPMDPSPINTMLPEGEVELAWTNIAPSVPGDSVWVDVWFGTDPNKADAEKYTQVITASIAGENATSVSVVADVIGEGPTTYYWQVDTYMEDPGLSDANMIESEVWTFKVSDDVEPTNVYAGGDMITWIDRSVDLTGTYEDDGKSPVKETWSSSDPSAVFSPSDDGGVTGNAAVATVTVDAAGAVTLTFTVKDELNPAKSDDMIVTVYEDACEAARVGDNRAGNYPGDFNGDCIINLKDFAVLAVEWLTDYTLPGPI